MMNRLQSPSSVILPDFAPPIRSFAAGTFHAVSENADHALFTPLHYEENYGYPLLVWLHGGGDGPEQLRRIMPLISLRNYVAAAPQGTMNVPNSSRKNGGYRWLQSPDHVTQAEYRVHAAMAEARQRLNIRPDRVFLAGYECGGTMAFRLAVQRPQDYAGVISLCGPFPNEGTPLANLDAVRRLPLFVASCRAGKLLSVRASLRRFTFVALGRHVDHAA